MADKCEPEDDFVTCIASEVGPFVAAWEPTARLRTETWCGRPRDKSELTFASIDHAALSRLLGSRLVACSRCVRAIMRALDS